MPAIELTDAEIELLCQALDSHQYWQLSDPHYRSSGYVLQPGSDDAEARTAIAACDALATKLGSVAVG